MKSAHVRQVAAASRPLLGFSHCRMRQLARKAGNCHSVSLTAAKCTKSVEAAMNSVKGTARRMGVDVEEVKL
jgi:ribosomal L11-like protein